MFWFTAELPQVDVASVRFLTLKAVTGLVGRELAIRLLSIVGGVILARLLAPSVFGLFALGSFVLNVFALVAELAVKGWVKTSEKPSMAACVSPTPDVTTPLSGALLVTHVGALSAVPPPRLPL